MVSSRFQFVEDHRGAFGVKRLCRILAVSRSGLYRHLAGADARARRVRADAELAERIGEIHRESDGTYGVPRVTAELKDTGRPVNYKRVERVMRKFHIVGLHLRKKVRTTIPSRRRHRCRTCSSGTLLLRSRTPGTWKTSPDRQRPIPLSGYGVGPVLETPDGLVDR